MTKRRPKNRPALSETGKKEAEARKRRLAAALRTNLRRRKVQLAERRAGAAPGSPEGPDPGQAPAPGSRRARQP